MNRIETLLATKDVAEMVATMLSKLVEVIKLATIQWDAAYLMLMMHGYNENAKAFYRRLGFTNDQNDVPLALDGDAFTRIGGYA